MSKNNTDISSIFSSRPQLLRIRSWKRWPRGKRQARCRGIPWRRTSFSASMLGSSWEQGCGCPGHSRTCPGYQENLIYDQNLADMYMFGGGMLLLNMINRWWFNIPSDSNIFKQRHLPWNTTGTERPRLACHVGIISVRTWMAMVSSTAKSWRRSPRRWASRAATLNGARMKWGRGAQLHFEDLYGFVRI